ncbi:MAG: ribonuclease [Porphyromonadaceae bacterium]|nr:ribonuclease [Porphyromonadaceae bacterium]
MKNRSTSIIIFLLSVILGILLFNTFLLRKSTDSNEIAPISKVENPILDQAKKQHIDELTSVSVVVPYVKKNGQLPDYYITKSEARNKGWVASKGNLCDVLPGRAIGGDIFTNRERNLPTKKGRIYYEADLNYNCVRRNADRLVFSNDGLIFITYDHYNTFEKQ